jgi:hypothetical protein
MRFDASFGPPLRGPEFPLRNIGGTRFGCEQPSRRRGRRLVGVNLPYEDLFDIEKRPGAGLSLWTKAVETQLERVRDANYRHRLNHSPNQQEKREDPDAERQLHADVYFLALAIRRVLLFHDAFAKQVEDDRLDQARTRFDAQAPNAKRLRDFFEHIDEYLLDRPTKHVKVPGRTAPVLLSRWDCDNVVVRFGDLDVDVTLAATAAIELGTTSEGVWIEHLERVKSGNPGEEPPPADDGVPRMLEVTMGPSTVIGGEDEGHVIHTGVLLGVRVRELTDAETAQRE